MLIPVANRPVIHYAIDALKGAGARRIGLVVSENRRELEPALGNGAEFGVKFEYIMQQEQKGIAHAVLCAEDFIGGDDFILYLGDNLIGESLKGLASEFRKSRPAAAITLTPVPEPRHFGVAVVKGGRIVSIEEKPKKPKSNLAVCGIYVFSSRVFEAARRIKPSRRGEYEITDTIGEMVRMGLKVTPHVLRGWWRDTGQKSDMLEANQAVLDGVRRLVRGKIDAASRIEGRVIIEEGAVIKRSVVRGPAIIGKGARICGSRIGPYSSIGDGSEIENSEVENSILMNGVRISNAPRLIESSLIGNNAVITGAARTGVLSVTLSDRCNVEIG